MQPSAALAAFAEPLISGRRVVVFGSATSGLAETLIERGARLVHVYDKDLARVAEATARGASRSVSYAPLGQSGVAVRDGAFDVALLENVASYQDPPDVLAKVRRALSARGCALIASPNHEQQRRLCAGQGGEPRSSLGYYDLYDVIAEQFEHTRMFGQAPFVGYAIAEFSPEDEPDVSFDSALVPGGSEEPEWFVAFASHIEMDVEGFMVVQFPMAHTLAGARPAPADLELARASRARDEALQALEQARRELAEERERPQSGEAPRVAELTRETERQAAWIERLEARAAAADERAEQTRQELERERAAAKTAAPTPARSNAEERRDLDQLEELLRERGARIAELEAALRSTERTGEDLLRRITELGRRPAEDVTETLDALSRDNARLTADVAGLRWTVEELENEIEELSQKGAA